MAGVALAVLELIRIRHPESIPKQSFTLHPLHHFAAAMNKGG
jgi:hypothetical protein